MIKVYFLFSCDNNGYSCQNNIPGNSTQSNHKSVPVGQEECNGLPFPPTNTGSGMPNLAVVASGGGFRAMIAYSGVFKVNTLTTLIFSHYTNLLYYLALK